MEVYFRNTEEILRSHGGHSAMREQRFENNKVQGAGMGIALGPNQYGKAENRVVRVYRDTDRHEIRDLNVSTALRGDFTAAHITGDQGDVLPTDTQKNTAFAFAKEKGVTSPEQFGIALGAQFLDAAPKATASRIGIEEYTWERIEVDGSGHDHSFVRRGPEFRTTVVTTDDSAGERRVWSSQVCRISSSSSRPGRASRAF